jgi:hypothetical protein
MDSSVSSSKHRIRRMFNMFKRSKRDSGVAMNDNVNGSQFGVQSEADSVKVVDVVEPEDVYSNDGEPNEDNEYDRRNFKYMRTILRETLEDFALNLLYPSNDLNFRTCRVTLRREGSFHHAVFVQVEVDHQVQEEYVLKIPAHGTHMAWRYGDRIMLENEAMLMQHIRRHTSCPVPEVVTYDGKLENEIGVPYILMKKIKGIPAMDMWLGQPHKTIKTSELHLNADDLSPELEVKRLTFLRSLADAMSQLSFLEFDKIGLPVFSYPEDEQSDHISSVWR